MLWSKLHCQKEFILKHVSCKIIQPPFISVPSSLLSCVDHSERPSDRNAPRTRTPNRNAPSPQKNTRSCPTDSLIQLLIDGLIQATWLLDTRPCPMEEAISNDSQTALLHGHAHQTATLQPKDFSNRQPYPTEISIQPTSLSNRPVCLRRGRARWRTSHGTTRSASRGPQPPERESV